MIQSDQVPAHHSRSPRLHSLYSHVTSIAQHHPEASSSAPLSNTLRRAPSPLVAKIVRRAYQRARATERTHKAGTSLGGSGRTLDAASSPHYLGWTARPKTRPALAHAHMRAPEPPSAAALAPDEDLRSGDELVVLLRLRARERKQQCRHADSSGGRVPQRNESRRAVRVR